MDSPSEPAQTTAQQPISDSKRRTWWWRYSQDWTGLLAGGCLAVIALLSVAAPILTPFDPVKADFSTGLSPPSWLHPFGTDALGRDVLSRVFHGGRISLAAGFFAVFMSVGIGVTLGIIAGYWGKHLDTAIMAQTDLLLAFPPILLAILLVAVLGPTLMSAMIAVGIARSPIFTRLSRAMVLANVQKEYVLAARAVGASSVRVLVRHILPNSLAPLIVQVSLSLGAAILATAGLGFLGLGAQPPTPEWGAMVSEGRNYVFTSPHLILFPGAAIGITVLALNLLGDSVRDALDPHLA